jgi:SAM-dependent methyltransferase
MVAGFAQSPPNQVLMRLGEAEVRRPGPRRALDIGCGAGRNAIPLQEQGWDVFGIDSSAPMLSAAVARRRAEGSGRVLFARADMEALPVAGGSADLIVAHGIWNLADSAARFRGAVREAARVARPGAALFVFTFSRHTLPAGAAPVTGETFVFTQFSGQPQCFLTAAELIAEMALAGFDPDPAVPLTEYNRRAPGSLSTGAPVIYEAAFRYR